jgi:3',5'-cyclic AMP phosphodiesterase CpdA
VTRCSILHLSDLHYESPDTNFRDDNKAYVEGGLRVSYFRNLHRLLKQCFHKNQFAAIAVTGDITTHGRVGGFDAFKETRAHLTPLAPAGGAICMVPGNHDVTWDLETKEPDYFDKKFKAYRNCVVEANATSSFIPSGTIPANPHGDLTFAKDIPGPFFFDHDRRLAVLCINSAMRCGEVNDTIRQALRSPLTRVSGEIDKAIESIKNNGDATIALDTAKVYLKATTPIVDKYSLFDIPHVTHTQLDQLGELLFEHRSAMKEEWPNYVKVALLHHHLAPFDYQLPEYKPFEVMADASNVLDMLADHGFQTIFTGHKHQSYIQRLQSRGTEVLVLGGMTVGGYAVSGFIPSIRHIDFEQSDGILRVRIADLPCNFDGNIDSRVKLLIGEAHEETIFLGAQRKRSLFPFPNRIESAAEDQLYGRSFYKTNVEFEIEVTEAEEKNCLVFESRMSYVVVNRTSLDQEWRTEYNFDRDHGSILEAEFNGDPYDPEQRDFQVGRGLSIRRILAPHEEGKAYIHAKERWPDRGSTFFTSYHPATSLTVVLRSQIPRVEFDFEILYFRTPRTIRREQYWEVHLEGGLLPYQGVRVSWKRKD